MKTICDTPAATQPSPPPDVTQLGRHEAIKQISEQEIERQIGRQIERQVRGPSHG